MKIQHSFEIDGPDELVDKLIRGDCKPFNITATIDGVIGLYGIEATFHEEGVYVTAPDDAGANATPNEVDLSWMSEVCREASTEMFEADHG